MNSVFAFLAKIVVGKQVVGALAWVHNALDGHRSEISLGILALVHGLKLANIIPAATADAIEKALAAILPVVLADKAAKVIAVVDGVTPALPENPAPPAA